MQNLAQPEQQHDSPGATAETRVSFRCSKAMKRALKMRAVSEDKTIEELCLEAIMRGLQQSAAA